MPKIKERACRTCHLITRKNMCPQCKTYTLSSDYSGVIIILKPRTSEIAQKMNITVPGKFALRVR
ncbi:MAG: transcription elongation factor subunit Spt4 [Promethearchaeota archaeon]